MTFTETYTNEASVEVWEKYYSALGWKLESIEFHPPKETNGLYPVFICEYEKPDYFETAYGQMSFFGGRKMRERILVRRWIPNEDLEITIEAVKFYGGEILKIGDSGLFLTHLEVLTPATNRKDLDKFNRNMAEYFSKAKKKAK